ncbi:MULTISPECIES: Dps family protein [Mammaliicoccus]|jgi:starvation-inducible DNA-binding protein|uniref:DNA starvation/stationary phase protection protein n=1 Tax=Mammaliicoccus lentus TaxID=42858 RepID=A0AAP1RTZ6_MAMLE|nr:MULTISPECIES: Dps family protein [Mammaliicoccus]HBV04874.1 DNA starvation/stationary phase protection protein [Staphylococcus sp.]MBF0748154.1 DNA starvation/stationary phase protection protein [Mammaliicoccus lentus]MBF0794203.1 DNA starvation/stationary phase protection protein [Mammaliicoccus lentus]MBF0842887.1 DNA starvation/stationary phase protection protein [Mammaliicoccus lentus]MBU6113064.1 DNA starvation/stationary phase protection protein [Mammaliicoccus lentus]
MNNNKEVIEVLNKQVAEWTVLFTKLHNYHWYVKGPNFFSLHEKFEELYNEASVYIDDIAERILAIDGNPIATLQEALEWSEVKEAEKNLSANQMVEQLSKDFTTVIGQLEEGIQLAEKLDDEMTGDMLLGMVTSLEKHNWMLKSFLG